MIKTHISTRGRDRGKCSPCHAHGRCPIGGDFIHNMFAGMEEVRTYNTINSDLADLTRDGAVIAMLDSQDDRPERDDAMLLMDLSETSKRLRLDGMRAMTERGDTDKERTKTDIAHGRELQEIVWGCPGLSEEDPHAEGYMIGPTRVTLEGGWTRRFAFRRLGYDDGDNVPVRIVFGNGHTLASMSSRSGGTNKVLEMITPGHERAFTDMMVTTRDNPRSSAEASIDMYRRGGVIRLHDDRRGIALDSLIDVLGGELGGGRTRLQVKINRRKMAEVFYMDPDKGPTRETMHVTEMKRRWPSTGHPLDVLFAGDTEYDGNGGKPDDDLTERL